MLDLNLTAEKLREPSGGHVGESGTSNSSVVNAEASINGGGDDDSCSTYPGEISMFSFDILKKGSCDVAVRKDGEEGGENGVSREFVTRELFPVIGDRFRSTASSSRPHWADLAFCRADSGAQMQGKLAVQPQQVVKKSRRGPRSRSSQYRGVTFYRRTGRWESHIWLVIWFRFSNRIRCLFRLFPLISLTDAFFFSFFLIWRRDCGKQVYLGKEIMF